MAFAVVAALASHMTHRKPIHPISTATIDETAPWRLLSIAIMIGNDRIVSRPVASDNAEKLKKPSRNLWVKLMRWALTDMTMAEVKGKPMKINDR